MIAWAGGRKHRAGEEAFTLIELIVVILILSILVGIAVPVYLNVTHQADRRVAQYNIKAAEEIHGRIWFDLMERNNFADGGGSYIDANPPAEVGGAGAGGYVVVDAHYLSALETRIPWVDMTASGSLLAEAGMLAGLNPDPGLLADADTGFQFNIAGLYRNGELIEGAEAWANDLGRMPGKIAVLVDTVFIDYTWCTNPDYKYLSMLVMEKSGTTYILTFYQGQLQRTYDLSYDSGTGGFNFPSGPTEIAGDSMKFTPNSLNIDSNGNFHCSFDVDLGSWPGFNEDCFDMASIVCGNARAIDVKINDSGKVLITFDREDLTGLEPGNNVPITISGKYTNGQSFAGTTTIKVIENHGKDK